MMHRFSIVAHVLSVLLLAAITLGLAGCEQAQTVPVQPVTIDRSDFCEIMRDLHPPTGKITWDIKDTPATIHQIRRTDAAVDKTCGSKKPVS